MKILRVLQTSHIGILEGGVNIIQSEYIKIGHLLKKNGQNLSKKVHIFF